MSRRWARVAPVVVMVVASALLASACSGGSTLDKARAGDVPAGGDPNSAALPRLSVHQEDVPQDLAVVLYPNGDQTGQEVTLDLCNGTFPSEALRIARRQMAVVDQDNHLVFSSEAVGYRDEAATAQAFQELKNAQTSCPTGFQPSAGGGDPLRTVFNANPDQGWPPPPAGIQRLVFDMLIVDQQNQGARTAAVYLRRGRILLGLYYYLVPGQDFPTIAGQTTVETITEVFATRLSQLSAKVVGG